MKSPQRRKASVEVRILSSVFSHNSHRVCEWSIVNSETNFVAWREKEMLIVSRNQSYSAYFVFILSYKGLSK